LFALRHEPGLGVFRGSTPPIEALSALLACLALPPNCESDKRFSGRSGSAQVSALGGKNTKSQPRILAYAEQNLKAIFLLEPEDMASVYSYLQGGKGVSNRSRASAATGPKMALTRGELVNYLNK
jgi:hypothetical protein